jgi:hypothetical protein
MMDTIAKKRREQMDLMASCVMDGRAAYRSGTNLVDCPFIDPDKITSWKMGWRWEEREETT